MERLVCLAIGYVFGIFQTAYIYGKMHGLISASAEVAMRSDQYLACAW